MKVTFRPAVAADLGEIRRFISNDNPARALTFVEELLARCNTVGRRPRAGRRRTEIENPEIREEIRSVAYRNYVIFYRVEADRVRILRVIHGARDVERLKM